TFSHSLARIIEVVKKTDIEKPTDFNILGLDWREHQAQASERKKKTSHNLSFSRPVAEKKVNENQKKLPKLPGECPRSKSQSWRHASP
ncbi:MAG: hypothetical protein O2857_20250, partial [Planctomycetota bacterium]|nr:hypothetical protein [Planctomycetota bacterium]